MKKTILYLLLIILIIGAVLAYLTYQTIWSPNVSESLDDPIVYVEEDMLFDQLALNLKDRNIIKSINSFRRVAQMMKVSDANLKSGRYKITPGWNNRELLSHLRSGKQEAVNLTFNNVRKLDELAGKVSAQLSFDSLSFLNYLTESEIQESLGFDEHSFLSMFIPNTYKVYWNTSEEAFVKKMKTEHDRFWNADRLAKAEALELSPKEVYTLASIVEKETLAKSEKNRIAGLYLNRLKRNMLLQADPTVVFAVGDFGIRRVLNKHLELDSPFNTYKNLGLPPGPIYMPDISTIDATLSPEEHNYIFFCARPDNSGLHAYAKTNAQHAANARKYHSWLNKQQIYK